nr:RHS repeat-associated core domain-containing protein [Shewanella sp. NKUCC06_TVS]
MKAHVGSLGNQSPFQHVLRDHLGSVDTLIDGQTGAVLQYRGYDVFGRPQDIAAGNVLLTAWQGVTKGYTNHEHLNEQQLIHMNGRIYDFNVGRFLSVDPFLQFPENSQSANPYSYILNNPMAGTDPTGYACAGSNLESVCDNYFKDNKIVTENMKLTDAISNTLNNGKTTASNGQANELQMAQTGGAAKQEKKAVGLQQDASRSVGNQNIGITGEIKPIEGNRAFGFLKTIVRDFSFGIIYGDTSSIPSMHPTPEDSADMQAYEEQAGAEKYAMAFLPSKGGKAVFELGQSQLKAIRTINNITANGLKDKDFIGVGTEMMQSLKSKLGDKYWNHIKEMNDNLRGLRKSIKTLEKVDNPQANEARLKAVDAIDKMEGAFKGHGI